MSEDRAAAVRADRWLWAARFFKTRPLAARACELGRVTVNGQPVKPGRSVRAGERLRVRTEAGEFDVEILAVSEIRGPATAARSLYVESEESRLARQREADQRRELHRSAPLPPGRPSGRDRRAWDRIRGRA